MGSRHVRGPLVWNTYKVVTTGNYVMVNESMVLVIKAVGAATQITLPPTSAADGRREVIIVDGNGDAGTHNITVVPAGADTINGTSSWVMATNYSRARFVDNGAGNWCAAAGAELTTAQAAFLSGVTAGTVTASKAVVVNSSSAIDAITITTLAAGATTLTGRLTTTDGVTAGTAKVVGGLAYNSVAASTAIASTSAETQYDTFYTLPADTLKAGTLLKIRYQGICTTAIGSDTLLIKLYLGGIGGTALITAAAAAIGTAGTFTGEFELTCRTAGVTGTAVGVGLYKTSAAEGTATMKDVKLASTTVNTTHSQVIGVAVTANTANANSSRLDFLRVEIL